MADIVEVAGLEAYIASAKRAESFADTSAPSMPTGLVATPVSTIGIDLIWNPSTDNVAVTGYLLLRNGVTAAASLAAPSFADRNLSPGTAYTYVVRAFDAAGNVSPASAPVTATTPATAPPPAVNLPLKIPGNFQQIFFDDGPAIFNRWNKNWLGAPGTISKPVNADEIAAYDPAQVTVEGTYLALTAIAKSVVANDGKTYGYVSGLVNTYGKTELASGVVQARIYLPPGPNGMPANWPAFWQDGHSWPGDGESDTMEILGTPPQGIAAVHFHGPNTSSGYGFNVPGNWSGWHTFAEDRYADHIDYWYDGAKVGTLSQDMTQSKRYIIINNALSLKHGGALLTPAKMLVAHCGAWARI